MKDFAHSNLSFNASVSKQLRHPAPRAVWHSPWTILSALALVSLFSAPSSAQAAGYANIYQGNVLVGGSLSVFNYRSPTTSFSVLNVNPSVQYFVIDGLALGGQVSWSHDFSSDGFSSFGVGPSATYFFLLPDRIAPFVSEGLFHTSSGQNNSSVSSGNWSNSLSLGVDYFFTPSVALGPALVWNHSFASDPFPATNTYGLSVSFSLFL